LLVKKNQTTKQVKHEQSDYKLESAFKQCK